MKLDILHVSRSSQKELNPFLKFYPRSLFALCIHMNSTGWATVSLLDLKAGSEVSSFSKLISNSFISSKPFIFVQYYVSESPKGTGTNSLNYDMNYWLRRERKKKKEKYLVSNKPISLLVNQASTYICMSGNLNKQIIFFQMRRMQTTMQIYYVLGEPRGKHEQETIHPPAPTTLPPPPPPINQPQPQSLQGLKINNKINK